MIETAKRELFEEVGVSLSFSEEEREREREEAREREKDKKEARLIGRICSPFQTDTTNLKVACFVASLSSSSSLFWEVDKDEVEATLEIPLSSLCSSQSFRSSFSPSFLSSSSSGDYFCFSLFSFFFE